MFELVNSRLSIRLQLLLIGALFCAPIALLVYIFVEQSLSDIDFARREIDGTRYIAGIWPSFSKTASSKTIAGGEIAGRASFDQEFGSGATSAPFFSAKDVNEKLQTGKAFIGDVADKSNLTLDPDLDSFYAMDAATVRLPGIVVAATELERAFAEAPGAPRLVDIAFAVSHLQTSADDAQGSLASSIKGNADGLTAKALSAPAAALKAATDAAIAGGQASLSGQNGGDLPKAVEGVIASVDAIWAPTNAEVARLLSARIDRFYSRMFKNLGFATLFTLAAVLLSFAISNGLARRLARLLEVMERLTADDASLEIPYLADANETGKIAKALAAFKVSVIGAAI